MNYDYELDQILTDEQIIDLTYKYVDILNKKFIMDKKRYAKIIISNEPGDVKNKYVNHLLERDKESIGEYNYFSHILEPLDYDTPNVSNGYIVLCTYAHFLKTYTRVMCAIHHEFGHHLDMLVRNEPEDFKKMREYYNVDRETLERSYLAICDNIANTFGLLCIDKIYKHNINVRRREGYEFDAIILCGQWIKEVHRTMPTYRFTVNDNVPVVINKITRKLYDFKGDKWPDFIK